MVDLPRIPVSGDVVDVPRSSVSGSEIEGAFSMLARGLDNAVEPLRQANLEEAQAEGQGAVYRDENGAVKFDRRNNLTERGRAFNRAATQTALVTARSANREALGKLRLEANGDVQAFDNMAREYRDKIISGADRLMQGALKLDLDNQIGEIRLGLFEDQTRRDIVSSERAIKNEISLLDAEMAALAKQGGTSTKEYLQKSDDIKALYGELVSNPLFQVNQREVDTLLESMTAKHTGEYIVGRVDEIYSTKGIKAAQEFVEKGLDDPGIPLSPKDRRRFQAIAKSYLKGIQSENAAALKETKLEARSMMDGLKAGQAFDETEIVEMADKLAMQGDPAGSIRLMQQYQLQQSLSEFADMSDGAQAQQLETDMTATRPQGGPQQAMAHFQKLGWSKEQAAGVVGNLWQESQFADDVISGARRGDGGTAAYAPQWRGERLAAFEKFAKERGKDPSDFETQLDFVDYELRTSEGAAGQKLRAAKTIEEATAAFIGFERPAGWTPENPRGGHAYSKRLDYAMRAAGGGKADPAFFKAMKKEVAQDARNRWQLMREGLKKGLPLAPEDQALLGQQIALVGDEDLATEVRNFLTESRLEEFPGFTPIAQQANIDTMTADGVSTEEVDVLEAKRAIHANTVKMLDEDPIGLVAQRNLYSEPVRPLDFSTPEATAKSLVDRQRVAAFAEEYYGRDSIGILRPDEIGQMSQTFGASGDPQAQMNLLNMLHGNLKPETYMATVAQVAEKSAPQVAVAGGLMPLNSEAAMGVLRGRAALMQNPKLAPKEDAGSVSMMADALPMDAFAPEMGDAYNAFAEAARARYADLSLAAGDQSGVLNEDRWNKSVSDVTGGFVEHNGKRIVAPEYGMTQGKFDELIGTLTGADFSDAVDATGKMVDFQAILDGAVLTSVGNGQYTVQINTGVPYGSNDAVMPYLMSRRTGMKFVLDFGTIGSQAAVTQPTQKPAAVAADLEVLPSLDGVMP